MGIRPALAALLLAAGAAQADTHGNLSDTLNRLAAAFAADPRVQSVEIDTADQSVRIVLQDGQEMTGYPDNLHDTLAQTKTEPGRRATVQSFVAGTLDGAFAGLRDDGVLPLDRVYPVLRPRGFATGLAEAPPVSRPFVGDLALFLVVDSPATASYVTDQTLTDAGAAFDTISAQAHTNLGTLMARARVKGDGIYFLTLDGYYESSALLIPDIWHTLDAQLGSIVAAAPARDLMLFVDGDMPNRVTELRDLIDAHFDTAAYRLTPDLYRWTGSDWQVLPQ